MKIYAPKPTEVTVTQDQTTGTKIGTIIVNGEATDLYTPKQEPAGDKITVTADLSDGTKIGTITVNGVETILYAPAYEKKNLTDPTTYTVATNGNKSVYTYTGLKVDDLVSLELPPVCIGFNDNGSKRNYFNAFVHSDEYNLSYYATRQDRNASDLAWVKFGAFIFAVKSAYQSSTTVIYGDSISIDTVTLKNGEDFNITLDTTKSYLIQVEDRGCLMIHNGEKLYDTISVFGNSINGTNLTINITGGYSSTTYATNIYTLS